MPSIHEEYYEAILMLNPTSATYNLDHRYDSEYIHHCTKIYRNLSRDISKIFREKIKNQQNKDEYLDILSYVLDLEEQSLNLPFHLMPVDHFNNPFKDLLDLVLYDRIPFTEKGISDFKKRILKFIEQLEEIKENILEGLSKGICSSQIVISLLIKDLQLIKKSVKTSIENIKSEKIYKDEYLDFMNKYFVVRALDFASFLETNLSRFSKKFGLYTVKNATLRNKMYQFCLDSETNIKGINPQDIYKLGLKLVQEYDVLKKELGPDISQEYKKSKFSNEKDIIHAYDNKIKEIFKELGHLFPRPKNISKSFKPSPLKILHEKNQTIATYNGPDISFKKKGSFNLNIVNPKNFFKGDVLYLSMHENVFGHGYQIPVVMSNKKIPKWLRTSSWDSTDESWALYCEWFLLNLDKHNISFNVSDIEKYALINSIQLRNVRLVVDVAIHYYGISQKNIRKFIKKYVELSDEELISETDRYSALPGQATTYATGLQYILKMRDVYLKNDNEKLASFHAYFIKNSWKPIGLIYNDFMKNN